MQNAVIIAGKNGAGKSSFLDAIQYLFAGKREIPKDVIRHGESSATVFAVLEDGTAITREFKGDKVKLDIVTKQGAHLSSPQAMLNKLTEGVNGGKAILFDPNQFSTMKPPQVIKVIKDTMGINTDEIDATYDQKFEERRQLKKDLQTISAITDAVSQHELHDVPPLEELQDQYKKLKERHNAFLLHTEQKKNVESDIASLEQQLQEKKALLAQLNSKALIEPPPLSTLEEKILLAKENEQIKRQNKVYKEQLEDVKTYTAGVNQLTKELQDLKTQKQKAIEQVEKFPIKGLKIEDNNVYINGVLLENISQGERLLLGVQAAIALQPKLKLLLIRDASLLDEDNLQQLIDIADETDTSILLEVVGNPPQTSILITNGERT